MGSGRVGEIEVELAGVWKSTNSRSCLVLSGLGPRTGWWRDAIVRVKSRAALERGTCIVAVQEMAGISETQRNNDVDTMLADSANVHMASTGDM